MITSYEDLVEQCVATGKPHWFLYVFLKTSPMDPATQQQLLGDEGVGTFVSIAFDAHEPVKPSLTFPLLVANADTHSTEWSHVVIAPASEIASDAQLAGFIHDLRQRILGGHASDFIVFSREGKPTAPTRSATLSGPNSGGVH